MATREHVVFDKKKKKAKPNWSQDNGYQENPNFCQQHARKQEQVFLFLIPMVQWQTSRRCVCYESVLHVQLNEMVHSGTSLCLEIRAIFPRQLKK